MSNRNKNRPRNKVNSEKLKVKKRARNEAHPGYKKTRVGWIPKEWECLTIKEVCSQPVSGFSAKGADEAVFPKNSAIGVLRLSCIMEGYFNPYENKRVIQADIPKVKTPVSKNTMLISRSNTEELVGLVCYVEENYPNLFLSDLIWQVSAKNSEILNIRWLTYLLLTEKYRRKIAARANGTSGSMKKITKGGFLNLPIPLPPLPEQKKIAEILSAWDRAIEQVGKLIDAKQRLKKGLMQQLLSGRIRFPEFAGSEKRKVNSEKLVKGELPEGWRIVKLGDVATVSTGNKDNKDKIESGKYPFFVRSQIIERINSFSYDGEAILVPGEGKIGEVIHYINGKFDFHQRVYKISDFHSLVFGLFLFYNLKYYFPQQARRFSVRMTADSLRRSAFTSMKLLIPSHPEQIRIAAVLSTCDREIELLKKKLEKLKEQKKGLMQKLLTGEIRHPEFLKGEG